MYDVFVTIVAIMFAIAAMGLLCKTGYWSKLLFKLGIKAPTPKINWTALSWESCLLKLGTSADIVFLGDSITRGGNFHQQFSNLKIVNLGSSGDTLQGMCQRVSTVKLLQPKQVFLMGGINGLTNLNGRICIKIYEQIINHIQEMLPETTIYVLSVLPVAKKRERKLCKNSTIVSFNQNVAELAQRKGLTYIDLYNQYVLDGSLNPRYCKEDGLHLLPTAYDIWYKAIAHYVCPLMIK